MLNLNRVMMIVASLLLFTNTVQADFVKSLKEQMILDLPKIDKIEQDTRLLINRNLAPQRSLNPKILDLNNIKNNINPRIVGGVPTKIEDNPWQVALVHGDTPDFVREQFCGGSLIQKNIVLTAAHCVDWLASSKGVDIVAGTTYFSNGGERIDVKEIKIHPNWNPSTNSNDFAILILDGDSVLGKSISLTEGDELVSGSDVIVSGWGRLSEGGASSQILMHVAVPVVTNNICNAPESYNGAIDSQMFCAGLREGGYDACQGDSGGPVYSKVESDGPVLVGVVSWGHGCARQLKYGVYSRISSVIQWIQDNS